MYFENPKKSYYRFPSKASVTDYDAQIPYYFPTNNNLSAENSTSNYQSTESKDSSSSESISTTDNSFN